MKHDDALRQLHHRAHDMLDQQDRQPVAAVEPGQDLDQPVAFGRTQARHDLVQKQQLRAGGERTRHFQALAIG